MPNKINALGYYGGKAGYGLAEWIVEQLPYDNNGAYFEIFGGMAGVLLARPKARVELLNDLDGRLINWWRVVRDYPEEFGFLVENTPRSRAEFERMLTRVDDESLSDIDRALAFHVCLQQSIQHGTSVAASNWQRAINPSVGSLGKWRSEKVSRLASRLWNVQLECKDAVELLWDIAEQEKAVVYVDPPYPTANTSAYRLGDLPQGLGEALKAQKGAVAVSGYGSEWDELGWRKVTMEAVRRNIKGTGDPRTEVLWCNFDDTKRLL